MASKTLDEGDVKMILSPDGIDIAFDDDNFVEMESGFENLALITLNTENGYALNSIALNGSEAPGSQFFEESKKAITVNQLKILEAAAEKDFEFAIENGEIKSVVASITYFNNVGYQLTLLITPPVGQNQELIFTRNSGAWVNQAGR